jgi:RNA polymerase sigma-70 factor (ECF subfamily)
MAETPHSLLERIRAQPDELAWKQIADLYMPLIHSWVRRAGLNHTDADDLVQDVLQVLFRKLPEFRHDGRTGAFRHWLRTITAHRLGDFWRAQRVRSVVTTGTDLQASLEQLEDPQSDLTRVWDREHDEHVTRRLLEMIRPDFEPNTWLAFTRVVLEGQKSQAVADQLGMSVNAVFIAKSRVLARLRDEGRGLID